MRCQTSDAVASTMLDVSYTIRTPWDSTGYEHIVRSVLGKDYDLSLVLIGNKRSRALNKEHRNKDAAANVLTFPLSDTSGEVFINVPRAKAECSKYGFTHEGHVRFLLIHACLHLKGLPHGSRMERAEEKLVKQFNVR